METLEDPAVTSRRSMEPPTSLKVEMWTPDLSVKHKRVESPVVSYLSMKSDRSMEPPHTFKREIWDPVLCPGLPAVAHTGPGDVACDICCGRKLRAVKTCVTCSASYCESHVRQHYTVPALQRHTLTQVTGDQRHTHQQDNVRKTESVKEEEKSETAEKKKAKMRISKLEQFKPGLKNISRHLEMGVAKALNRQRTTHSAGGVWEAALDPHFYGDLFSGKDFDFIPDIPETHVAPTDSLEKFIKLRTDQPIEANFLSKLVKKLDPATAWAREVRGGLQHRVERELERCRPEEGIIAHRTVTAGPHLASKVESLKDRAEGVIWNEICAKSLQK